MIIPAVFFGMILWLWTDKYCLGGDTSSKVGFGGSSNQGKSSVERSKCYKMIECEQCDKRN